MDELIAALKARDPNDPEFHQVCAAALCAVCVPQVCCGESPSLLLLRGGGQAERPERGLEGGSRGEGGQQTANPTPNTTNTTQPTNPTKPKKAVEEVLHDVLPVLNDNPEFFDALDRMCEPERQISFRVPW